jgi:hypothetical protein
MTQAGSETTKSHGCRAAFIGFALFVFGLWWWWIAPSGPSPHLALVDPRAFRPLTPDDFGWFVYLRVHFARFGRVFGPATGLVGLYFVMARGVMKARAQGAPCWPGWGGGRRKPERVTKLSLVGAPETARRIDVAEVDLAGQALTECSTLDSTVPLSSGGSGLADADLVGHPGGVLDEVARGRPTARSHRG